MTTNEHAGSGPATRAIGARAWKLGPSAVQSAARVWGGSESGRAGLAGAAPAVERASSAVLLERLQTLRTIVPAMAADVAAARRDGARLRRENAVLQRQLAATDNPPARQESR